MQRISRLVEDDGRKVEKIEAGFDQLGMRDYDLHAFLDLSRIPGFALRCVHARPQNCRANAFVAQNPLQPGRDVVFLRVHREHLAAAPFSEFFLDLLDQFSFFGIKLLFRKIPCLRNDESNIALQLRDRTLCRTGSLSP